MSTVGPSQTHLGEPALLEESGVAEFELEDGLVAYVTTA